MTGPSLTIQRPQKLKPPLTVAGIYNWCINNRLMLVIITAIITVGITQLANRIFQRPQEVQVDEYFGEKYQMVEKVKPWFYLFFKGPKEIVLNKEGIVAYIANNYKEALEKFDAGITLNPKLSYFHNNRAVVLNEMTRIGNTNYQYTVKAEFEWASELEPHNPIPYENLAHFYGGAPYDKARKYLVKANDCEKRPEWKAWLKKVLEYRY